MAKYSVTYSCGHEGIVNIIGPHKDREWKRQREESKMCPDCWKKYLEEERERKNREAAEKAAEMELPELTGSPKQVAWANTLRQEFIEKFDEATDDDFEYVCDYMELEKDDILKIKHYILENKTEARFWIDHRDARLVTTLEYEMDNALKSDEAKAEEQQEKEFQQQVKAEATVYPEEKETNAVVEIDYTDDEITAITEKNETFRKLVRNLGFRWDSRKWRRKLSYKTGSPEDRAAELGNKLLNSGFPIRIYDKTVRRNAVEGNFEPEHKRWIGKLADKDRFAISWSDGKDWYRDAKSLPGAKWENPFVTVSVDHFKEVEEFAELYDFKFSPGATEMIKQHKKALRKAEVVDPAKVDEEQSKDGLQEILESEADVLDDLRD